ncbi:hypothetical protein B0A48_08374 [Cryoendolithus antarcticus]|uniref:Uncharacterized protein n=1 Tax=Cryoendolithus antarcticus TaxID=1507870 RepID=A0A1V8T5K6_9PEZI|nr:hypothetical protein B0A48_08374 [Cryoendolithus antarcticus]
MIESSNTLDEASNKRAIWAAIEGYQIVISGQTGYGTLRKSAKGTTFNYRNKDFSLDKREILLLVPDSRPTVNGFKDFVVENSCGETCEIYHDLKVRPFQDALDGNFKPVAPQPTISPASPTELSGPPSGPRLGYSSTLLGDQPPDAGQVSFRGAAERPSRDPQRLRHPAEISRTHEVHEGQRENGMKRSREQADALLEDVGRRRPGRRE